MIVVVVATVLHDRRYLKKDGEKKHNFQNNFSDVL